MSIVNITFDSNVFPKVVNPNPDKFPDEQALPSFQIINSSIKNGYAKGFLAETVFTIEAIKKIDRHKFFRNYNLPYTVTEYIEGDIRGIRLNLDQDNTSHPGNNTYNPHLTSQFNDALELGFKILPCKRFGWIENPDLESEWFIKLTHTEISLYKETFGEVVDKIKNCCCGSYDLEEIGNRYTSGTEHWIKGFKNAPPEENKKIEKAFAEWADGDAIASHIAHRNQYFCTRDQAKNAGQKSVMSENNRKWLEQDYGIKFVSPEDLAQILTA